MVFQGKTISLTVDSNFIASLCFDAKEQSINKFNIETIEELRACVAKLATMSEVKGLLVYSAKETFIVGADITQFHQLFAHDEAAIEASVVDFNSIFAGLEDVPFPTVALIDGIALGGGFELALACDFRVISAKARLGLPEVKLGINPGFGGTVRLPRLIGCDNAIEWIATGKEYKADAALAVGAVDGIVDSGQLRAAGLHLIEQARTGKISFHARRLEKISPVKLNDIERLMTFTTAKGLVAAEAGPHMPAPLTAVKSIEKNAALSREDAIKVEAKHFARLAKTEVSANLIALFLSEQDLSKRAAKIAENIKSVKEIAVVGAGIMGGGIAYQSAIKGKLVVMKDIAQAGLDQGMAEASKLLSTRVDRGQMTASQMAATLNQIKPRLDYAEFTNADIAIEAVVENMAVKQSVLLEVEKHMPVDAIITSNTSTLSITALAANLKRPGNFCGMHFFNPVHKMPLVEVIRGKETEDYAIAKVVKLALDLGKSPIVVNDCVGFYVNRVLFPYLAGFNLLLRDGADFLHVDKVMEKFGWPMGPAYLIDVVGIDTACHVAAIMGAAYPERMASEHKSPLQLLNNNGRYGQKNGIGFYTYEKDKKGKPVKKIDAEVNDLLKPAITGNQTFTDEEIIERLMIPMCLEVVRCLDDGIVTNPVDAEMGLVMGIGFPVFRGGALHYMESLGLQKFIDLTSKYQDLGELYRVPLSLFTMAQKGRSFFATQESAQ
jgi:3-hydroxyacyl-CoA dehydrogenase / enoyl-CoA hydratase / 3-hydroxybutyryl-CoA epimerase / enoyl-CoA isomerase